MKLLDRLLHRDPLWAIEKWKSAGRYHNSPKTWSYCGVIRAADWRSARNKAAFIVGSSQVRVEAIG